MADLTGFNNTPLSAILQGALSYRNSAVGEGTIDRILIDDSTGLFASFSPQFGGTPGADQVDNFSFLNSGLSTVRVSFDAAQFGTYANFLMVTPISGVSSVSGIPGATWAGGEHVFDDTLYNSVMEGSLRDLFAQIDTGVIPMDANFSDTTWARNPVSADAIWTLDGKPVVFEVYGMQMDGTFGGSQFSRIDMSDVDYSLTITPVDLAYATPARDGLAFTDTFGISETHTGLAGTDTYAFNGDLDDLSITFGPGNQIEVAHLSLPTAADTLVGVERILTNDATIAFDINGKAGQAYRLYEAAFDRDPDLAGLGFWIGHFDAGNVDIVEMAGYFMQSPEFASLYGAAETLDDEDFLTVLYNNVLDRDPDAPGFDFWRNQQDNGLSRAEMLQYFSESTENYANTIGQIEDGIYFI